jgi:hypothetical protein
MQSLICKGLVVAFLVTEWNRDLQAAPPFESKNGSIMLNAKPEPIAIDPARAAVIVVDMENDFVAKGGMFDRLELIFPARKKPSLQRQECWRPHARPG